MGLLTILRKAKARERDVRILVLGLDNAGKTTVVRRLRGADTSSVAPTLGFDITTMAHAGCNLNFWDVGGQQTIRAYWRNYFERTDAVVWVVDSADRARLRACRLELEALMKEEKLAGATLLVLANKQDLPGALDCDAIADALGLHSEIGKNRHWRVAACAATTEDQSESLRTSIDWLVEDIGARIFLAE